MSCRFLLFLGILGTLASSMSAQAPAEVRLLTARAELAPSAPEETEARSTELDDRGLNRMVRRPFPATLTIYRPGRENDRGVAVVICPGGGYAGLAIDKEGHAIARFLQGHGFTGAVLKYRMPQPDVTGEALPLSQEDALAAVRWLRTQTGEGRPPFQRVGIMGFSAGGHLAGSVAVLGEGPAGTRPDFAALIYPVVCLEGPYAHAGSRRNLLGANPSPARLAEFSLERRARAGLPPHFLVHARDDKGVPVQNSELLAKALQPAGVPVELLLVDTGGHGFGLGRTDASRVWGERFVAWLRALP